ncbi:hypothetical protein AJ78_01525 [Emergomyces pasteurianus Ep9510]|uniref:Uncharacterized protein n=1 Tax=Emergomyces pasteurianus Ep9510 TaxID=1447872 RepID=A0A1J9QT66_9EURO|nr:hypothetical protein AJ78_01525 [Emergomyces pasteurianus Ep9510]
MPMPTHKVAAATAAASIMLPAASAAANMMVILSKKRRYKESIEYKQKKNTPPMPVRRFEFDLNALADEFIVAKFDSSRMKYRIVTPDDLLFSVYDAIVESRSDGYIFKESRIEDEIKRLLPVAERSRSPEEDRIYLFADPAYTASSTTMRACQLSESQAWFKKEMLER